MPSYRKILPGAALLLATFLPAVGSAAMVASGSSALDTWLTGFARPRILEIVPGSSSVGMATYAFRPLYLPVDLPTPMSPLNPSGNRATWLERNRTWNSGQHSFLRPQHGHRHGYEGEDDLDEHPGEHGHGHGNGHGGTPVPLPAPWLMLVSGLAALLAARRLAVPQG